MTFMIVDVNKYETDVTVIDEAKGKIGYRRIENTKYQGLSGVSDEIYQIVKGHDVEKLYIDLNGIGMGVYDHLIGIKQDRVEIIPLKGTGIILESRFVI